MESITPLQRDERADGILCLDSLWQAKPTSFLRQSSYIRPEMFAWIDRAEWRARSHTCHWQIESKFLPDVLQCSGVTSYEPALGGRGTRVTFEGEIGLISTNPSRLPFVDHSFLSGFELLASSLIPRNMRKLTEAVESFLLKEN